MSTLLIPDELLRSASLGRTSFRGWLKGRLGLASPSPRKNGTPDVHGKLAPVAAQAFLGESCNAMILQAVSAGGSVGANRLAAASEQIEDCLRAARDAHGKFVQGLSTTVISPVDVDDLLRLSRLFLDNLEFLSDAALALSRLGPTQVAVEPFHAIVGESFKISIEALQKLGDRGYVGARAAALRRNHLRCRAFCRQHFDGLLRGNSSSSEVMALFGARQRYLALGARLNEMACVLSHAALKNG